MRIRLATIADRDVVIRLVSKLFVELGGKALQPDEVAPVFHDLITREEIGFVALCETEDAVVAVCTVSFLQALRSRGRYAIIQEMYVEPDTRSTGIGKTVIEFVLDHAATAGCRLVELGTPMPGQRPIRFYERIGFAQVGARLRWTPTSS